MAYIKTKKILSAGFAMVELSIALAISSVVVMYALLQFIEDAEIEKAEAQSRELEQISGAFASYLTNVATPLMDQFPPPIDVVPDTLVTIDKNGAPYTIANIFQPTYQDLINLGYMPGPVRAPGGLTAAELAGQNLYQGGYAFRVDKRPANCTRFDLTCELHGVVALTTSVTDLRGQPDYALAGVVAQNLSLGAFNLPANINNLNFLVSPTVSDTVVSPVPGVPAQVGAIALSSAGGLEAYLRRDGSTPMTGNLRMEDNLGNRHNIEGADIVESKAVLTQIAVADDVFLRSRGQWLSDIVPQYTVIDTLVVSVIDGSVVEVTQPSCAPYMPYALDPTTPADVRVDFAGSGYPGALPDPNASGAYETTDLANGVPKIHAWPVSGKVASRTDVGGTIAYTQPNPLAPPILTLTIDNDRVAVGYFDIIINAIPAAPPNPARWTVSYRTDGDSGQPGDNILSFSDALLLVEVGCEYN